MDGEVSGSNERDTLPPQKTMMGSTFVAATEAMQTAVDAMVAAAETLKQQAYRHEEHTASSTQPRYSALLEPNTEPSPVTIPARAASRIRRALTPTRVDRALHSSHDTTVSTSAYRVRRQEEYNIQPNTFSRSQGPLRPAHKKFDYGYYRNLTAAAAANRSGGDGGPLTMAVDNETFEMIEPISNPWPCVPASQDSRRTLCPVDHAIELDAHSPYTPEDEEMQRLDRVDTHAYRRPRPPSSVYSSCPRDHLDGTEMETLPVMRIGRYMYIRSDTMGDFHYPFLGGDQQQQRHHRLQRLRSRGIDGGGDDGRKSRLSHYHYPPLGGPPSKPKRPYGFSLFQEIAFVALICIAQLLMLSGMAQALVPQYLIGSSFQGTTPGDLAWYSAAYGLTAGTFVLPSGRLGDVFGHKNVFIIGWVWFAVWELAGGCSPYIEGAAAGKGTIFFIVCRALQGIGPALLVPNGQAMLGMAYHEPGPRKNLVMCLFGAAAPLGFVFGAVMSSLFAQTVGEWEYGFFVMAGACTVFAGLSFFLLPPSSPRASPSTRTGTTGLWTRLDAPGIVLGVVGMALVNFAFNQAPIVSWSTPYTYFLLVIGVLLLLAFAHHERTRAAQPLVPVRQLPATTGFVLGCTAAGWASFSIWCYYAFSFLQQLRGWPPLSAAASFAPAPVMGLVASLLTGFLLGKKVRPQLILLVSMCAFLAGSVLWATAPVAQSYWLNCFLGILVMPFGMDMSNPAASILLSNSLAKEHQGVAASLVVTTVNYSISVALGIAGSAEAGFSAGGQRVLAGYRAGQYVGLGFGAFGILLAGVFLLRSKAQQGVKVV